MSHELNTLLRKTATYYFLQNKTCKEICLVDLLSRANELGYSFEHWEKTKVWMKKDEIPKETQKNYTEAYTVHTEHSEKKENAITQSIEPSGICPYCGKGFDKKPKTKVYCSTACKDSFNNELKKRA